MREPRPAHIQRPHRDARSPAAPSYKLEMAYTAFSPRQLAKAEKMRPQAQSSDRLGWSRPSGTVRELGHGKGHDRLVRIAGDSVCHLRASP
jgi:hypothetical protein